MYPLGLLSTTRRNGASEESHSPSGAASPKPTTDFKSDPVKSRIEDAVIQLYEKHAAGLLRYGQAISGELEIARDAVQEAFLRYYVALREETVIEDPRGWLYSTTRNYILDRLKDYYFRNGETLQAASNLAEDRDDPEGRVLLREIDATAHSLLTNRELACLRLRSEGLRYRDIARLLQIETATVGVLLGRALKKIRAAVNQQENRR
jgi:RNA polymerase sigma-70 factor (ECF subfamily)